jgi:hypothetical protein
VRECVDRKMKRDAHLMYSFCIPKSKSAGVWCGIHGIDTASFRQRCDVTGGTFVLHAFPSSRDWGCSPLRPFSSLLNVILPRTESPIAQDSPGNHVWSMDRALFAAVLCPKMFFWWNWVEQHLDQ